MTTDNNRIRAVACAAFALLALLSGCQQRRRDPAPAVTSRQSAAPDPVRSSVVLDQDRHIVANGRDFVVVTVTLRGADGMPLFGWPVELEVSGDANALGAAGGTTDANGQFVTLLRSSKAELKTISAAAAPGLGYPRIDLEESVAIRFVGDARSVSPMDSIVRLAPGSTAFLANGVVAAPIEVVARDLTANPVPGISVELVVAGDAQLEMLDAETDDEGVARALLRSGAVGRKSIAARFSTPIGVVETVASVEVDFLGDAPLVGEPRLTVGRAGGLEQWSWQSDIAQFAAVSIAGHEPWPSFVVAADSPARSYEHLMICQSTAAFGPRIRARHWNGRAWVVDWETDSIDSRHAAKRGFDVAFESRSGDAIAVCVDGFRTPRFRTWDGAEWSDSAALPINDGAGPGPETNDGIVVWVELASSPVDDRVALAFADATGALVGLLWNGHRWDTASAVVLEHDLPFDSASGMPCFRGFDLAFAPNSGDLHVAWGRRSGAVLRAQRARGAAGWAHAAVMPGIAPQIVDLEVDASGRVAIGCVERQGGVGARLGAAVVSGDGAVESIERAIRNESAAGTMPVAMAWHDGSLVCVHADDNGSMVNWVQWRSGSGWAAGAPFTVPGKNHVESVALRSRAAGLDLAFSDRVGNLFWVRRAGASWHAPAGTPLVGSGIVPSAFDVRSD